MSNKGEEKYFVIIGDDDGEPRIRKYTKTGILKFLSDNSGKELEFLESLEKLEHNEELHYLCSNEIIIIKGNIVTPKLIKYVIEYDIE